IYASVGANAPQYADSLVSIDSATGAVDGSVVVGSDPGPLALSSDGSVLYVGQKTLGHITPYMLPDFTPGASFALGNDIFGHPDWAEDIEVQPGTNSTLAVTLDAAGSPRHDGTVVFDSGVPRPMKLDYNPDATRVEFGANPSQLYGDNNETT